VIPVLTPDEMAGVDRRATVAPEVLVERAGAGVAKAAMAYLGGVYGKRITVVAGKGNNGNDGRSAAARLTRRGASVRVVDAARLGAGARLGEADLIIDAAYGTGLGRPYAAPDTGNAPVIAVDIPSGLSGLTGLPVTARSPAHSAAGGGAGGGGGGAGAGVAGAGNGPGGGAVRAAVTVTLAALKPGLVLGDGPTLCGGVELVDIGLGEAVDAAARAWLVEDDDAARLIPPRPFDSQKYNTSVQVVAGSPGMTGAPWMVSVAAMRAGAGYVRLGMPGVDLSASPLPPGEVVAVPLPAQGWDEAVRGGLDRYKALVVGPGLGPVTGGDHSRAGGPVVRLVAAASQPAVIDADGLNALGSLDVLAEVVDGREAATVITPHAGEYRRLVGEAPGSDRVASVRDVARRSGAVVLLKGSTTVVASPDGRVLLAAAGTSRLATAGTGDVLSGVIGALLAQGVPAWEAAGLGAHIHGRAARLGFSHGLVATDLPDLIARWLSEHLK
jgi:NAD(P)H-hydrate epimerase